MSQQDEKKLNQDAELAQLRDLVGDAGDGAFELDDILAEYSERSRPKSVVALSQEDEEEDLLVFPQSNRPPDSEFFDEEPEEETTREEQEEDEEGEAPAESEEEAADVEEETVGDEPDNVIEFPAQPSRLVSALQALSRKADRYAEHMFEQEDLPTSEATRRIEELVPGVDREETANRTHRRRHRVSAGPDTPPQELAREYSKGLKSLRTRSLLVMLLALPALFLTVCHLLPLPAIPNPWLPGQPLLTAAVRSWAGAVLLAGAMALSFDVLWQAARRLVCLRPGPESILLLACVFSLADCVAAPWLLPREETGYFALNILALFCALHGEHHRRRGLRLACRTAAASANPYRVTLDEGKWNGRDTYAKHIGTTEGFGRQIQAMDGARRAFALLCPVLLCACVILPVMSCLTGGRPQQLLWALSAVCTAACSLSAPLVFSRPFHKLSRRLARCGAAIAGWPGVVEMHRGDGILLTDHDLFPTGSVSLNGMKVFGEWSGERVISYTATLIRDSGSGLDKLFGDLLRTRGVLYRQADRLCCYEGGGLSANIRGDQVLVGSAAFMKLMEVELPQGHNVKNAVFCAIDGELAGIFALNYTLPDAVFPAIDALLQERLAPVLATRDFNVIPAMLRQRFRLAAERMDFPPVQRRRELSEPEQPHNNTLTAILCREGIFSFSEAVVGARRLRQAVRLNAALVCVGSVLGTALACYLTAVSAFASISPVNLLLYLLLWLVPSWFITGWTDQY